MSNAVNKKQKIKSKFNLNIILMILLINLGLIASAQAVVIKPGVIFDPTESNFYLLWNYHYEDDKAVIVDATYVQIGGIKIYCDSQMLIKIVVNGWHPENKDKEGETVFDLEFHPDKAGSFTVKFEGLKPEMKYTILKNDEVYKVVVAKKGVITFSGKIKEPTKFVVICGEVEEGEKPEEPGLPPIIPPEESLLTNPAVIGTILGVIVAILIIRKIIFK